MSSEMPAQSSLKLFPLCAATIFIWDDLGVRCNDLTALSCALAALLVFTSCIIARSVNRFLNCNRSLLTAAAGNPSKHVPQPIV